MTDQIAAVRAAYQNFMRAKYPAEQPPDGEFKFFDPTDSIPDKGLAFLPTNRKVMLQDQRKMSLVTAFKSVAAAKRTPPQRGWYIAIGPGWMFLAPTIGEAVELFKELENQINLKIA